MVTPIEYNVLKSFCSRFVYVDFSAHAVACGPVTLIQYILQTSVKQSPSESAATDVQYKHVDLTEGATDITYRKF